jgi:hypothetical protein
LRTVALITRQRCGSPTVAVSASIAGQDRPLIATAFR